MDFLTAENVRKQYAGHLALDDVSINVKEGSIFGLLGPNGAGKTTLIRIINRIISSDSGNIHINGETLNDDHVYNIGYLPEERGLYRKMKVGEQALYLARLKGLSKKDATEKLKAWFEKFDLMGWWNKKVEELSKGMQQKIQFIVTILHEPQLLIFDEPFSGFDPINANIIKKEVLELKEKGATIIFSTHNMESVEELCDKITLINKSKNILSGEVNKIKQQYKSNEYKLIFEGDFNLLQSTLSSNYKLLENKKVDNKNHIKVKLLNNISTNEFLKSIMNSGNIISFNEIIPSMNDIFIKVVNEKNLSVDEEL